MNKYRNKKVIIDGFKFDSKKESVRYDELKQLQKIGMIKGLSLQPEFLLQEKYTHNGKTIRAIKYIADFEYFDNRNKRIIEDVKSKITASNPVYRLKKKMLLFKYKNIIFKEIIR